jgi:hypothetical protein
MPALHCSRLIGALMYLVLPCAAQAGGDAAITLGTGPDGFDSRALDVGLDLGKLPLHINAGYLLGSSNGETNLEQATTGVDCRFPRAYRPS